MSMLSYLDSIIICMIVAFTQNVSADSHNYMSIWNDPSLTSFSGNTTRKRCTKTTCMTTVKCYVNNVHNRSTAGSTVVDCDGVCANLVNYRLDRRSWKAVEANLTNEEESVVHQLCENHTKYPSLAVGICTDVKTRFPHLHIYKSQHQIHYKYCCRSDFCNKEMNMVFLVPQYFIQHENIDQIYFEYFIISAEIVCVTALLIWPIIILIKGRKEEKKIYTVLNQPLEEKILNSLTEPQFTSVTSVKKPVTGQLNFDELCRALTNMELRIRKQSVELSANASPTYKKFEYTAAGNGHSLVKVNRITLTTYESYVITHLIERGPYVYNWKPFELVSILSQAAEIFEGESTMLTLCIPITIIGDIRGQYQDLHRWLSITGFPPLNKVLFLGGVIDPEEPGSLDCLAFIAAMKVRFPHDVFLIRGMSETLPIIFQPRFSARNDSAIQSAATRLCNSLPIAARIANRILAVHSGLSHELLNYDCVEAVKRPFTLTAMAPLAKNLIFSHPTSKIRMYRDGTKTSQAVFGLGAVSRVCHVMGVKLVVRAHNPLRDGICWIGKQKKLISLWSAPAKNSEKGAVITVNPDFVIHVYTLKKQKKRKRT